MSKAQLESMEQVMIIFVVIIIGAIFAGIFFKIAMGSNKAENLKKMEQDAVKIATFVSAMPELQCTKNGVVTENCVNMLKADVLAENTPGDTDPNPEFIEANLDYYHALFGLSRITVIEKNSCSDGVNNDGDLDTDGDDTDCQTGGAGYEGALIIYDRSKAIDNPTRTFSITSSKLIYDPLADKNCFALGKGSCDYGFIKVEMFVR